MPKRYSPGEEIANTSTHAVGILLGVVVGIAFVVTSRIIDANDQKPLGYTDNPEITWSINASLNWKGLDFSMLWVLIIPAAH